MDGKSHSAVASRSAVAALADFVADNILQICLLLILSVITIYRRRLSSNDEYRAKLRANSEEVGGRFRTSSGNMNNIFGPSALKRKANSGQSLRKLKPKPSTTINSVFDSVVAAAIPAAAASLTGRSNQSQVSITDTINSTDGSASVEPTYGLQNISSNNFAHNFMDLKELSADILLHIVGYLPDIDIVHLMVVSRHFLRELSSEHIWEQLWIETFGVLWQDPRIKRIRENRGIFWDPLLNFGPPKQGWFRFYLLFETCWLDWLLAGYCTDSRCLLGIHGNVVDVTHFLNEHPGSGETVTEAAGCDATEAFQEIGHSSVARRRLLKLLVWDKTGRNRCRLPKEDPFYKSNLSAICLDGADGRAVVNRSHEGESANMSNDDDNDDNDDDENTKAEDIAIAAKFPRGTVGYRGRQLRKGYLSEGLHTVLRQQMAQNKKQVVHLATSNELEKQSLSARIIGGGGGGPKTRRGVNRDTWGGYGGTRHHRSDSRRTADDVDGSTGDDVDGSTRDDFLSLSQEENMRDNHCDSGGGGNDVIGPGAGADKAGGIGLSPSLSTDSLPIEDLSSLLVYITAAGSNRHPPNQKTASGNGAADDGLHANRGSKQQKRLDSQVPFFGPLHELVPGLGPYAGSCSSRHDHFGHAKAFYDPLHQEWIVWWSCCGRGQILVEPVENEEDDIDDDYAAGGDDDDAFYEEEVNNGDGCFADTDGSVGAADGGGGRGGGRRSYGVDANHVDNDDKTSIEGLRERWESWSLDSSAGSGTLDPHNADNRNNVNTFSPDSMACAADDQLRRRLLSSAIRG